MRFWFLALLWMASGCASLFGGGDASKKEAPVASALETSATSSTPTTAQVETKEAELKLAKILARMEELENELIRQKERMRLLERGLITGIVPEELSKEAEHGKEKAAVEPKPVLVAPIASATPIPESSAVALVPAVTPPTETVAQTVPVVAPTPPVATTPPADDKSYQEKLGRAHALLSGEHWGQAIAAYGAIGQEFPESLTQGHPIYWIGMSWFHLKEYQLAEKNLTDFLNRFAASPLAPQAHFYLAKTEFQMGMIEKAVGRFRNVIREFPADEAAKMAKMEMSRLDKAL